MNFKERKNLLEGKQQVHLLRFLDQLNDDEKQILFSQIDAVDWGFEQAFHNDKKKEDKADEKKDEKPKDIVVELKGIQDRIQRHTPNSSEMGRAVISKHGETK